MTKKRLPQNKVKKKNNKKLGILVLLLFFTMIALGGVVAYKVLNKQAFEQKIENLKKEKDDAYSQGSQKEHFRKEKSEIITYYPLVGDSLISSVKDIIVKDITDKVEGKEQLFFYYSEKGDSSLTGVENRLIKKQAYDLANSNVVELENTTLDQLYLKEDGSIFTLDQFFTDPSTAKEKVLEGVKSTLQDKKVDQSVVDQVLADFSAAELSSWKFAYKDSQLVLYPVKAMTNVEEIAMPISDFFDYIQTSYLTEKDAELYKKVQAEKHKKVVALTFDDGPDGNTTPQALDPREKYCR